MKSLYKQINFDPDSSSAPALRGFPNEVQCLIIDLSGLTYIDASGVVALKAILEELSKSSIHVLLASTPCKYAKCL